MMNYISTNSLTRRASWLGRWTLAFCLMFSVSLVTAQKSVAQTGESVLPIDSLALVAFYHSMNGQAWLTQGGWLVEQVDNWMAVDIEEVLNDEGVLEFRVYRMRDIPSFLMTLPGTLPPEMVDMTYFRQYRTRDNLLGPDFPNVLAHTGIDRFVSLQIRDNLLVGPIDWEAWGNHTRMHTFETNNNHIVSELPAGFGAVDGEGELMAFRLLDNMLLNNNYYFGDVPATIANMPMSPMRLSNNQFTGTMPGYADSPDGHAERFGSYALEYNDNNWDPGPFPAWVCEPEWLPVISNINLVNTNRTGQIPDNCIGSMTRLSALRIGGENDQIGGDLPDDMQFTTTLTTIVVDGGTFGGDLPEWLETTSTVRNVTFANAPWSGELPASWGTTSITGVTIRNTQIEGGIPAEWQQIPGLSLNLRDNPNMEFGPIEDWVAEFWSSSGISLQNVGVTGPIPPSWETLNNLTSINLGSNPGMTGPLPAWLEDKQIVSLRVSHSGFDIDEIPINWMLGWKAMARFNNLELGGYNIEGPIPSEINGENFDDPTTVRNSFRTLALDDNNLSGPIPEGIGTLMFLDSLNLANNNLSGELPSNFGNTGKFHHIYWLQSLTLSGNAGLTGMFPDEIANHNKLRVFEIDGTDLCISEVVYASLGEIQARAEARNPSSSYWSIKPALDEYYGPVDGVYCVDPNNPLSADEPEPGVAYRFRLHNNYPNPFNPTTVISYEIPADAGNVSLQVYNVIGQRIATLVNEQKAAGRYEVNFDATGLSSGTYIYRLEAGDRVLTSQMMLIK